MCVCVSVCVLYDSVMNRFKHRGVSVLLLAFTDRYNDVIFVLMVKCCVFFSLYKVTLRRGMRD